MTDEEILYQYIDLSESHLTESEKEEVMNLVIDNKKAFSLRNEIGKCPDIKVNIEVNDPSTFFVRHFPIAEEDKPLMDMQMAFSSFYAGCSLPCLLVSLLLLLFEA